MERTIHWSLLLILAGTFLVAAVSKALDPIGIARVLNYLAPEIFGDRTLLRLTILGLVALESGLAAWLILSAGSRQSLIAALVTLGGLTVVLSVLAFSRNAPSCGCLAIPGIEGHAGIGILRNVILIWMVMILRTGSRMKSASATRRVRASGQPGFTIIEMMVVIVVIAVILALSLPMLASTRLMAKDATRLSNLRQVGQALATYCQSNDDAFPFVGVPRDPLAPIEIQGRLVTAPFFRAQALYWANLIWPHYIDAQREFIERPEIRKHDDVILTEYLLTHAAAADSIYWSNDANGDPVSLDFDRYRGQTIGDVEFASQKGLLVDGTGLSLFTDERGLTSWITVDLAARTTPTRDFDQDRVVARPYGSITFNIMATKGGVRGID